MGVGVTNGSPAADMPTIRVVLEDLVALQNIVDEAATDADESAALEGDEDFGTLGEDAAEATFEDEG